MALGAAPAFTRQDHQDHNGVPAATSHRPVPYLQAWRLHHDLTVRALAKQAGVAASTIVRGEAGMAISALSATRLAKALGITMQQLREEAPPQ